MVQMCQQDIFLPILRVCPMLVLRVALATHQPLASLVPLASLGSIYMFLPCRPLPQSPRVCCVRHASTTSTISSQQQPMTLSWQMLPHWQWHSLQLVRRSAGACCSAPLSAVQSRTASRAILEEEQAAFACCWESATQQLWGLASKEDNAAVVRVVITAGHLVSCMKA